jgi:hypothetical protein
MKVMKMRMKRMSLVVVQLMREIRVSSFRSLPICLDGMGEKELLQLKFQEKSLMMETRMKGGEVEAADVLIFQSHL